jgi:hypothetical protein
MLIMVDIITGWVDGTGIWVMVIGVAEIGNVDLIRYNTKIGMETEIAGHMTVKCTARCKDIE